mmetsp:Transcript_67263/g.161224  ORF Transcript_67263/g.161224 Transcript_67263/m.161224 type:complete len:170 (-) Transcript_67263:92-601(-)|eukprot:CAMPEP_0178371464 /NCGR_PEP_ID=MMETSP0689_2-20121128/840_1 /TAXON_ID=160604 /ORGANISM="Amphidinium massartii, Strain CS-259" /LENGTH=169 /DNA_ID=CAMNT_0019991335 /DNA_START=90 /DNA_END=599 /DNA_ORIENTATION=+
MPKLFMKLPSFGVKRRGSTASGSTTTGKVELYSVQKEETLSNISAGSAPTRRPHPRPGAQLWSQMPSLSASTHEPDADLDGTPRFSGERDQMRRWSPLDVHAEAVAVVPSPQHSERYQTMSRGRASDSEMTRTSSQDSHPPSSGELFCEDFSELRQWAESESTWSPAAL